MDAMDTESLFGDHTRVRSFSDSEDDYADDPDPEARRQEQEQAPDDQEIGANAGEAKKIEPAKVKRVVKNPLPKLDPQRLAGPRGMFHVQKVFKDVKWKGKGREKEDLSLLLKHLEHWAHRLYPKFPFKDTLEAIEKLGLKKNVQVHMKRIRLDMVNEYGKTPEEEEEEVVRREAEAEEAPQGDIFDELLGENFSSAPPAASQIFPTPSAAPPATAPKPSPTPMTEEQKERLERNKRLAEEKRKARFLQQMEKKQAEANEAIAKGDNAEGIVESEKDKSDSRNDSSYLESTDLSLKENEKSSQETKPRESDNMEVDETESDKQKDVVFSSINSSNSNVNTTENKSLKVYSKPKKVCTEEELALKIKNVGKNLRREDWITRNLSESEKQKDVLSSPKNSSNKKVNKTKNSNTMKNKTIDSDKNKGQTEIESENISENMEEKTSDDLSQKNKPDSDSTELSFKENKKSSEGSTTRELDNMEVDETESEKQKDVLSSTINSSNTNVNPTENSNTIEDTTIDSGKNKGQTEIESENISENMEEKTSDDLSQKNIPDSDSKLKEGMEVDETESEKQKDVLSSPINSSNTNVNTTENSNTMQDTTIVSGKNNGQTEMESENISENMEEKTSDDLSQKNIPDSDSKPKEGMCTEDEMLAMIDSDL